MTCPFNPTLYAAPDLSVPEGFEIVEYAGPDLAPDIYTLTLDPQGRVVVSGKGYIRILVDDDNDGLADRFIRFATGPKDGAMGMLWENDRLYFTGEEGLRYYEDKNRDDVADGASVLVRTMNTGDEHGAHAIRRGPDGWLYVLGGNESRFNESFAELETSPISDPVAGCLIRFTPNLARTEVVADGFRNAYDFDFNLDGEIFTFDSDNERCQSLPWYEPTRFYHILEGGHHGWQNPQFAYTWRKPPYYFDVVAPVTTLGRGSPCGVECYRHWQFPDRYRGGFFVLDWTFGKVYFLPLKLKGASYETSPEVFITPLGSSGFAVTDLAVHPGSGDLFISTGGRGTRGAVYRIRHLEGYEQVSADPKGPASAAAARLDWAPGLQPVLLSQAQSENSLTRLRALSLILRHSGQLDPDHLLEAISANWDHPDRYVRWKTSELIGMVDEAARASLFRRPLNATMEATVAWGVRTADATRSLLLCEKAFESPEDTAVRLDSVRLFQVLLGDIGESRFKGTAHAGYSIRDKEDGRQCLQAFQAGPPGKGFLERIKNVFPTPDPDLNHEIARIFAMTEWEDPETVEKMAGMISKTSDPVEDLHYLIVLSRMRGPRTQWITQKTAEALLDLDWKVRERGLNRERNWAARVGETYTALVEKDRSLPEAILSHPDFGRSEHTLYAHGEGSDRRKAASIFLRIAVASPEYEWSPELVSLLSTLPFEDIAPRFREKWSDWTLRRPILRALATRPEEQDREKFSWGLKNEDESTREAAVAAIAALPPQADEPEKPTQNPSVWNQRFDGIDWNSGRSGQGKLIADRLACSACHGGTRSLGPDLAGISARFSREDLLAAILEPSRDIPSQYRVTVVETRDGDRMQGLVVYEANDSLILQNGLDETFQVNGEVIVDRWTSDVSLMPEGLLEGLSDQEIADLLRYLASL